MLKVDIAAFAIYFLYYICNTILIIFICVFNWPNVNYTFVGYRNSKIKRQGKAFFLTQKNLKMNIDNGKIAKNSIMKKIKLTKGLQINREGVSKLQENQMKDIKGGHVAFTCWSDTLVTQK